MTIANGRCESEPIACDSAAGSRPNVATSIVIMIGRSRSTAPSTAASTIVWPARAQLVDVLEHDDAGLHRDAEEREEADARRDAEVRARGEQREQPAHAAPWRPWPGSTSAHFAERNIV